MPLVVLLHGHSVSGLIESLYFGLPAQGEKRGFILLAPDRKLGANGERFWNSTDVCCDFDPAAEDDVAYLAGPVAEARQRFTIDPKRVYFAGHSNGGFMSYRMACDRADIGAAIVSLAGATYRDVSKCHPSEPVAVLQIHGTADDTVLYDGGTLSVEGHSTTYPGAVETVRDWASHNGCTDAPDASAPLRDLVADTDGPETSTTVYADGCRPGGTCGAVDDGRRGAHSRLAERLHALVARLSAGASQALTARQAVGGGGAIFVRGGRFKIVNSRFFNNACEDVGPDVGGASVRVLSQSLGLPVYVVNSTFGGSSTLGNACSNGGGLSSIGVSYTVLNSLFSHNEAIGNGANPTKPGTPGGGSGGAIYNDGNTFTLTLCGVSMTNNTANEGGGAIFLVSNNHTGYLVIHDSVLTDDPSGQFETFPGISYIGNGNPDFTGSTIQKPLPCPLAPTDLRYLRKRSGISTAPGALLHVRW